MKLYFGSIAVALCAMSLAAFAGQCEDDIAIIDKKLAAPELAADVRAQAQDMRDQASKLCAAGNQDEGLALAAEAKVVLLID